MSRSGSQGSRPGPPSRSPSAATATRRPAPTAGRTGPQAPTGIDYLAALGDLHDAGLREQVSYRSLIGCSQQQEKESNDKKKEEEEDSRG